MKILNLDNFLEKLRTSAVVLDLGCGEGSFDYYKYRFKVKALDSSKPVKKLPKNTEFISTEFTSLPFKDKTFDAIVANWTLQRIKNVDSMLSEIGRVLKDDGFFFCSIPDGLSFDEAFYKFLYRTRKHVNSFGFKPFQKLVLEKANLNLDSYCEWHTGFTYMVVPKGKHVGLSPLKLITLLPDPLTHGLQRVLVRGTRFSDSKFNTKLGVCGWLMVFKRGARKQTAFPSTRNICTKCGVSYWGNHQSGPLGLVGLKTYRCSSCGRTNDHFHVSMPEDPKPAPKKIKIGDKSVVIIASIPYTFPLYQRIHHFTSFFLKDNWSVLFIEPTPFTKNERPKKNLEVWYPQVEGANAFYWLRDKKYYWERTYRGMYRFFQLVRLLGGFKLYRFLRNKYERKIHTITQQQAFDTKISEKLAEYAQAKEKIAFFQFPHHVEQIPHLKELGYKIVYDMVDDIAEFEEVPKEIRNREIHLIENSDLVIATSKPLFDMAKRYNRNVKLIPNGVEYSHFVKARKHLPRPLDMPKGKPIIGYYGAIWTWFDEELLLYLARERPQYDFVLIGTILQTLKQRFSEQPNVHYLGEKKYSVLPNYLSHFDLAIVPFKENNLTKAVNPVKVYEYLAGGKQVVYKGLQNMGSFPCCYSTESKEEFLKQVDLSLKRKCSLKQADSFLKDDDWEHKYAKMKRQL